MVSRRQKGQTKGKKAKQNGKGGKAAGPVSPFYSADQVRTGAGAMEATKTVFAEILSQAGVTDKKIGLRIKQALDAKRVRLFFDREKGKIRESKEYVDHMIRLKAADLAARLKGHEPSKKIELDGNLGLQSLSDDDLNERITQLLETTGISGTVNRTGSKKKKT